MNRSMGEVWNQNTRKTETLTNGVRFKRSVDEKGEDVIRCRVVTLRGNPGLTGKRRRALVAVHEEWFHATFKRHRTT